MNQIRIVLLLMLLASCQKEYRKVDLERFESFAFKDTLVNNDKVVVVEARHVVDDLWSRLIVKSKSSGNFYLFEDESKLANDSTALYYYPAFIYDDGGEFMKNGIWVYTDFYTTGSFPFQSNGMKFSVDSLPKNWNKPLPTNEGIYYYKNGELLPISREQSEEKFKERRIDGFYFIPNSGRLYDKININHLD